MTMTAIRFSGSGPTFPRTRSPRSTASPSTASARKVLGPDVEIRLVTYDETNIRIRPDKIIADIRANGGRALIAFVGVQSNQFPRAADLAQPFIAAGLPVAVGGFHVSGCLAMLPELARRDRAAAGARRLDLRRRSGGIAARRGVARCLCGRAEAPLQLHEGSAGDRRPAAAAPVRRHGAGAPRAGDRASISAAAARSNAPSAPSSMCRAARAASARPTISK